METKMQCPECGGEYYVIQGAPTSCPFHYSKNSAYNRDCTNIEKERELSDLRHEYVGKVISVESGLIIILEVLSLEYVEFILMPEHRIYVAPLSSIKNSTNQKS